MAANGRGMECWGVRGRLSINRYKSLPASDALGLPIKPQYFIPLVSSRALFIFLYVYHKIPEITGHFDCFPDA